MFVMYESNRGTRIELTKAPYYLNIEPLFNYRWGYTTRDKKRGHIIAGFGKDVAEQAFTLHIMDANVTRQQMAVDAFNDIIETDIYDGEHGTIWISQTEFPSTVTKDWLEKNCWFTYGFIIEAKNSKWQYGRPIIKKEFTLVREKECWYRVTDRTNYDSQEYDTSEDFEFAKDYEPAYDYGHDYMTNLSSSTEINNPSATGSEYIVTIYGEVQDSVYLEIGDTIIDIGVELLAGEKLVVDSTAQTITMTNNLGELLNVFGARNPDYPAFRRIDSGRNIITWSGGFNWELRLIEERSEPRWLTA